MSCVSCICCDFFCVFFFFKQKTAYEMRISDWSSDVCSSDLLMTCSLVTMKPSAATMTPEPSDDCSRSRRRSSSGPPPKKRRKKGSSSSEGTARCSTLRLAKMLTTAGAAFLTTGAKDSMTSSRPAGTWRAVSCASAGAVEAPAARPSRRQSSPKAGRRPFMVPNTPLVVRAMIRCSSSLRLSSRPSERHASASRDPCRGQAPGPKMDPRVKREDDSRGSGARRTTCIVSWRPGRSNRKGSLAGCLSLYALPSRAARARTSVLVAVLADLLGRSGVLALGGGVAVDQLDDRHRRHVAVAEAGLQHPAVAAVALLVAGRQLVEQLGGNLRVAQHRERLPAGMQVAALAQGDETVDDASEVLRLGQRGLDLLVLHQGRRHVGEHRLAVADRAV